MYICIKCWRAENEFWVGNFFAECLLRIFRHIFRHTTNVEKVETFVKCRKSQQNWNKHKGKKIAQANFISANANIWYRRT